MTEAHRAKPPHLAAEYAAQFGDAEVAEAYQHRPAYPMEAFAIVDPLLGPHPRCVLELGAGTGDFTIGLAPRVDHLVAVEPSRPMLELVQGAGIMVSIADQRGAARLHDGESEGCSVVGPHKFPTTPMNIELDDLSRPAIHALLNEHLQSMYALSPPESVHALDLEKLRAPDITFWSAWDGASLLGCGALKELDRAHGEVKSMRTPDSLRRRGAGRAILAHIVGVARSRGYERLSLETGSMEAFRPAQKLYESFGFMYCGPFGDYVEDPNSVFMTLRL